MLRLHLLKLKKLKVSFFAPDGENTVCLIDIAENKRTLLSCERDGDYLVVFFDLDALSSSSMRLIVFDGIYTILL